MTDTHTERDQINVLKETNRRLNRRAQSAESELLKLKVSLHGLPGAVNELRHISSAMISNSRNLYRLKRGQCPECFKTLPDKNEPESPELNKRWWQRLTDLS